ncbi:MAG: hypothetical protein PVJ49_03090 [Acidobacteriota bacterium]|jgi:hypothetical protein
MTTNDVPALPEALTDRLGAWRRKAVVTAAGAAVLSLIGLALEPGQFLRSYLVAYLFWIALPLGALGLAALHYMVGGQWGFVIRRILESAAATIPLMALLFVPLLFGLGELYPWARPEEVAADPLLVHKAPYLNVGFFTARAALYFVIWIGLTVLANRLSARDRADDARTQRKLQHVGSATLVLYGFTVTFAAIDWAMSLEPHWFSTIYGMMFVAGQGLAAFAFATLVLAVIVDLPPMAGVVEPKHFRDLGSLTLAFVMLWAYMAYSQYLIIWSGNLPEEIAWYLHRSGGGWQYFGPLLIGLHFALPFLLLLQRRVKQRTRLLAGVALWILVLRYVDIYWLIIPAFSPSRFVVSWLDVVVPVAMGALWVAVFLGRLESWSLLPYPPPAGEASEGQAATAAAGG